MQKYSDDLVKMQPKMMRKGKRRVVAFDNLPEKAAGALDALKTVVTHPAVQSQAEKILAGTTAAILANKLAPPPPPVQAPQQSWVTGLGKEIGSFATSPGATMGAWSQNPAAIAGLGGLGLAAGGYGLYRALRQDPRAKRNKQASETVAVIDPVKSETAKSIRMKKRHGFMTQPETIEGMSISHKAAKAKESDMSIEKLLQKIAEGSDFDLRPRSTGDEKPWSSESSFGLGGTPKDKPAVPLTGIPLQNPKVEQYGPDLGIDPLKPYAAPARPPLQAAQNPGEPGRMEQIMAWMKDPANLPYLLGGGVLSAGALGAGAYALGSGKKKKKTMKRAAEEKDWSSKSDFGLGGSPRERPPHTGIPLQNPKTEQYGPDLGIDPLKPYAAPARPPLQAAQNPEAPGRLAQALAAIKDPKNLPYVIGGAGALGAGAYALGRSSGKKKTKKKTEKKSEDIGLTITDIFDRLEKQAEDACCAEEEAPSETTGLNAATAGTRVKAPKVQSQDPGDYVPEVKTSGNDFFAQLAATGRVS